MQTVSSSSYYIMDYIEETVNERYHECITRQYYIIYARAIISVLQGVNELTTEASCSEESNLDILADASGPDRFISIPKWKRRYDRRRTLPASLGIQPLFSQHDTRLL